jgi:hypothetical protein
MSVVLQVLVSREGEWEDSGEEFDTLKQAQAFALADCGTPYRLFNTTTGEITHPDETPFFPEERQKPPTPACPECKSNSHWVIGEQYDERKCWNPNMRAFTDCDRERVDSWIFCSGCGYDVQSKRLSDQAITTFFKEQDT